MINDILKELNVTGATGERLPYPMDMPSISRLVDASVSGQADCKQYRSRTIDVRNGSHYGNNNV